MANKRIMYIGGKWGNAIYFWDKEKTRIYGFKDRVNNSFGEGSVLFDLANNKYNETIPLYLITNIEYEYDPSDMFFADISLIGNVDNPKGEYKSDWFGGRLGKLHDYYIEKYNRTSFFKYRERRMLKKFIKTLEEMEGEV